MRFDILLNNKLAGIVCITLFVLKRYRRDIKLDMRRPVTFTGKFMCLCD